MASKKTVILSLTLTLLFFVGLFLFTQYANHIPANPAGTVGNTGGNLHNGGYFCESNGRVYFANPYDSGTLYRMNADETEVKKLNNAQIQYINAGGDYLYYYQRGSSAATSLGFLVYMSGHYRCNLSGKKVLCLDKTDSRVVNLVDNTLYYEKIVSGADTPRLYQISTNKTNGRELTDFQLTPASAQNSIIYYNGTTSDHYLYTYDTLTQNTASVVSYNMWFPTLCDNYIYFLDSDNNYPLCRYNLVDGTINVLTIDRVDCFNVYGNYIYYQKNDALSPALMRMGIDGSNPELVAEGNYCDINITSAYVYFRGFGSDVPVYRTPTQGPISVAPFEAARNAALENLQ